MGKVAGKPRCQGSQEVLMRCHSCLEHILKSRFGKHSFVQDKEQDQSKAATDKKKKLGERAGNRGKMRKGERGRGREREGRDREVTKRRLGKKISNLNRKGQVEVKEGDDIKNGNLTWNTYKNNLNHESII